MRPVTVAASLAADMVGYLRSRGFDADAVCARAGIDAAALPMSLRLPDHTMAALWHEAIAESGDPDLGLHTAVASGPGALDIVGYVMLSSPSAFEALRRGARLMRLLNDGLAMQVHRQPQVVTCELEILPGTNSFVHAEPRQVVETTLLGTLELVRRLTAQPITPLSVHMRHAPPATGSAEHRRLLGVTPRFAAGSDRIAFAATDVDVSLRSANPTLLAAFEAHAEDALVALGRRETMSGRVLSEILVLLKGESPRASDVARALATSVRQLQRGLASEGTTFQALLDQARRELAVRHLAAPGAKVAHVAWLVGFSEPSAFHRAFRRWTGGSPRAGRRAELRDSRS